VTETKRQRAFREIERMLSPEVVKMLEGAASSKAFGAYMDEMAVSNVFEDLWMREGLDMRSRSLLTLGILIALRAHDQIGIHALAAIRNGVTYAELEEIVYHAAAYAGFPSAGIARKAMVDALEKAGVSR
jgi:4-carboxymuconolactone decarboxylase